MKRKKLLSLFLTAAVGAAILAPTTAMAAETTTWDAPTEAMEVDNSIASVGIHAAASTTSFFLGGNVVAERASDYRSITSAANAEDKYQAAMAFTRLGAFGSSSNISPDPYLWNYFYNIALEAGHAEGTASDDGVYISQGAGSPMSADTTVVDALKTSYTLARRPDVLMGISVMGTNPSYDELIALLPENNDEDTTNDYNPIQIPYKANNFADLVSDMYDLSDAMTESGKVGRYGDTDAIAQNYEAYMKGLQYYIIEQIDKGEIEKKDVAVITNGVDTDDDGLNDAYTCVSNTDVIGTSTDRPAESIMYTANNLKDTVGDTATLEQIADTDAVIFGGHVSGEADNLIAAMKAAGIAEEDIPPIYDADPSDVFTIRANSVENFVGVAIFNGFLYPEVINPVDATMYVYENFWHLNESKLQTFAQANFADASLPEGITADGSTYDEAEIEAMIEEGLAYGSTPSLAYEYKGTTLELSDRLTNYDLNNEFSDVGTDNKFYDAIYWAVDNGITTGWKADNTFRPWNSCNRAAVVTFLWRAAGCPEPETEATFSDMTGNSDFDKAISWAAEEGITTGWDDNTFRPWNTCNRAAIVTFLWRYENQPDAAVSASFKDMTGNDDFDKAISWAAEEGITTGWDDNTFRPWNTCNRASVVTFLYRDLSE